MASVFCVYELVGRGDLSLYIGQTSSLDTRLRDHAEKEWFSQVSRADVTECECYEEALRLETELIHQRSPVHNVQRPKALGIEVVYVRRHVDEDRLLSSSEVARVLSVSNRTVARWVREGKLIPAYTTPGGQHRFNWGDVRGQLGLRRSTDPSMTDEPTHSEELAARIQADPMACVGYLYEVYGVLKRVHKYGNWDSEYYDDAASLWDRLGEWMYP